MDKNHDDSNINIVSCITAAVVLSSVDLWVRTMIVVVVVALQQQ